MHHEFLPIPPPSEAASISPSATLNESQTGLFYKVYHPNRAHSAPGGKNLLQSINDDRFALNREDNPHYPFANKDEWELVKWMTDASLTQQQIDAFLQLGYVRDSLLSMKYHPHFFSGQTELTLPQISS